MLVEFSHSNKIIFKTNLHENNLIENYYKVGNPILLYKTQIVDDVYYLIKDNDKLVYEKYYISEIVESFNVSFDARTLRINQSYRMLIIILDDLRTHKLKQILKLC